jgi:hypothetical protein
MDADRLLSGRRWCASHHQAHHLERRCAGRIHHRGC